MTRSSTKREMVELHLDIRGDRDADWVKNKPNNATVVAVFNKNRMKNPENIFKVDFLMGYFAFNLVIAINGFFSFIISSVSSTTSTFAWISGLIRTSSFSFCTAIVCLGSSVLASTAATGTVTGCLIFFSTSLYGID